MPIFVKGELLQRSLASARATEDESLRMTEFTSDNRSTLMRTALPSYDDESQFVDMDPKHALDVIQSTMSATRGQSPLADDLSSVGSMSQHSPVRTKQSWSSSVVQPIAEYDTSMNNMAHFYKKSRQNLSINTNFSGTASGFMHSNQSAGSMVSMSPYNLNPISSWDKQQMRRKTNSPTRPKLTVLTSIDDESREDTYTKDPSYECHGGEESERVEDEPSRTLDELIGLLEKGYRVKLHTFRGREKAFLFLRKDLRSLYIKREESPKKEDGHRFLETSIDDIFNLEFGRRSDSGFMLSPLTSFSLGIKDDSSSTGTTYYDLEAASPVQREVLVSTLMIMMDAFGTRKTETRQDGSSQGAVSSTGSFNESRVEESGTFDQPILCSPSLEPNEPIPCSPSLEMEYHTLGSGCNSDKGSNRSTGIIREVIHLDDVESFHEDDEHTNVGYIGQKMSAEFFGRGKDNSFDMNTAIFEEDEDEDQVDSDSDRLLDDASSGEITNQTSNVTATGPNIVDVVTVAEDLVIEAHLSDQSFQSDRSGLKETMNRHGKVATEEGSYRADDANEPARTFSSDTETEERSAKTGSSSHSPRPKEANYVFKQVESPLSGSAAMPIQIDDGNDIVTNHGLSFSFSDHSFDRSMDGSESVQGMLHSVRSRRMNRPMRAKPSYPARISEMEELHEMSFNDESPRWRASQEDGSTVYEYRNYRPQEFHDGSQTSYDESDRDWSQASIIERTALVDMPRLEVPTPHNIHLTGSSSQLIGGWCSDDVCTVTLNDMAKTCTGIFAAQQTQQHALSQAGCIDPTLTEAQTAMVEEYIASALGAPSAVYSYFTVNDETQKEPPTESVAPDPPVDEDQNVQKFRNRATRNNAQADRIRSLKNEMTFAHALKQSKELSAIRTTQSFDDAKLLPKLADNAAQKLHSSPLLDSLVSNMMNQWPMEPSGRQEGISQPEEESVYYDSDPEDSRPRTLRQGLRKVRPSSKEYEEEAPSRSKALDGLGINRTENKLGKKTDDDTIKEIVQSMMNERLLVMWHPTQSKDQPNRAPILARLWIESGVYLVDGSFLLPKLSWVKAFGRPRQGVIGNATELNKVDLLDICRIRSCDRVDRSLHPFANARLSWFIETQQDVFLFESETAEERDRIVYGLKLVVARLASLLMLRDIRAADEFFGAVSSGVPGEAPVWTSGTNAENKDEDMVDISSMATPVQSNKQ